MLKLIAVLIQNTISSMQANSGSPRGDGFGGGQAPVARFEEGRVGTMRDLVESRLAEGGVA
ncbi:hypothetical protein AUC69_12380 [Methyloceanibacter superfactus]|uniref:Uncharacterized protein n=1 Tax=Methyloceanibacter superfactus TaxID=1774969 RepID=A0A1E3VVT4_9HYPH|nr:hypothetical protein AUC69_12380 [Methyloceanibacter superfactus]